MRSEKMNRNDILIIFYTILVILSLVSFSIKGFSFSLADSLSTESAINLFSSPLFLLLLIIFGLMLPEGEKIKGVILVILKAIPIIYAIFLAMLSLIHKYDNLMLGYLIATICGFIALILEIKWKK
jgi:hypothetical protein